MRLDLERWRAVAEPFYEVYPDLNLRDNGVCLECQTSQDLLLTKLSAPPQTLVHDPKLHPTVSHDYVLFERFYKGGGRAIVADREFDVAPSRFHIIDMSQRYISQKRASKSRSVCIPHVTLKFSPGLDVTFGSLELDTPAGRLIALAHEEVVRAASDQSEEQRSDIADTFVELIRRFMLGPGRSKRPAHGSDLPASLLIRDYISLNLHRPDLDRDLLISIFGVSRSALYRQFEDQRGVDRYIRNRRLDRCHFELSSAPPRRGRVTEVAERWQFFDMSHFHRLFRQRFNVSPSLCHSDRSGALISNRRDEICLGQAWLTQLRTAS